MRRLKRSYCSFDLSHVWKQACFKAFGLEDWELVPNKSSKELYPSTSSKVDFESSQFIVVNLLNDLDDDTGTETMKAFDDPWMATAKQIHSNICEMTAFLSKKRYYFIQLDTPDDESSFIQSTVASFVATTAAEIESLHQCLSTTTANQKQNHCAGIVQILMIELKERVAEPFGFLSKQRQRVAVEMWQTPIQSRLWIPKFHQKERDTTLELLGLEDDELAGSVPHVDQRFLPKRPSHRLHMNFWQSYESSKNEIRRIQPPPSLAQKLNAHTVQQPSKPEPSTAQVDHTVRKQQLEVPESFFRDDNVDNEFEGSIAAADLQQETMLLQMKTQSDLDSVQKMEQTMVDITALLSHFSNLVVEQQENVWDIHDATVTTKENIQKGKENLEDAKERVASSKHFMASAITAMGVLLLFLHWLRP